MKKKPKKPAADGATPRTMMAVPTVLYQALKKSAQAGSRPVAWELRLALMEYLTPKGFWPPPETEDGSK
jgi:hypothetical protein